MYEINLSENIEGEYLIPLTISFVQMDCGEREVNMSILGKGEAPTNKLLHVNAGLGNQHALLVSWWTQEVLATLLRNQSVKNGIDYQPLQPKTGSL